MHTDLHIHLGRDRAQVAQPAPRARRGRAALQLSSPEAPVALRPVREDDQVAVERLSTLDARPAPQGDVLLALVDGEPVAALSLEDGAVVANPFAPTAGAVELLQVRAQRLQPARGAAVRRARRRWAQGRRAAA
jgi:hypothetical protein